MPDERLALVPEHRLTSHHLELLTGTQMMERMLSYRVSFPCEGTWEASPGNLAVTTWVSPMYQAVEAWLASRVRRPYYVDGRTQKFTIWFSSGLDLDAFCTHFGLPPAA